MKHLTGNQMFVIIFGVLIVLTTLFAVALKHDHDNYHRNNLKAYEKRELEKLRREHEEYLKLVEWREKNSIPE